MSDSGLDLALRLVLLGAHPFIFASDPTKSFICRTLVHAFPEAGLGVSVASDSVIYQTDVFSASNGSIGSPKRRAKLGWGSRGVLVLIGVRLGLDGVNPIYYDTIKV